MGSSEKDVVKQQFSRNAEQYVTSQTHASGIDLQLLIEWTQPQKNWIALDIATGGGHVAKTVAPHVHHMIATDLTPRMLKVAADYLVKQAIHNISFVIADAEKLPFLDESFDLVTCRIAAHHFPNPEQFIKEVARVLRPHGKFLFIDNVSPTDLKLAEFQNTFEKMRDESHVWCPSIPEWSHWIQENHLVQQTSNVRKKAYPFPEWVKRTTKSEKQIQDVETFLLQASNEIFNYFAIKVENGRVITVNVDEWVVLCSKN